MRAIGMADTDPKAPNKDRAGKPIAGNRALNRRVVLHVRWLDNQAAVAPRTMKKPSVEKKPTPGDTTATKGSGAKTPDKKTPDKKAPEAK